MIRFQALLATVLLTVLALSSAVATDIASCSASNDAAAAPPGCIVYQGVAYCF
ncbi:MAG TPA: hypothetical protein VMU03_12385 [Gammaproteobacteria bacterium]|jgi:hypothetical protein|nr:hypothetical protein [Gammaproteobacteria bacterium]